MHLSLVSTMDVIVLAIQEASSHRKRAFSASKQYISSFFSFFLHVIFDQLDTDPIRRIPNADPDADDKLMRFYADPDAKQCLQLKSLGIMSWGECNF